jgi:hypothetical protein
MAMPKMNPSELLRELHESNQRLERMLREAKLREKRVLTEAEIAELRWLELDYEDQKHGDWTR